jgi:MFS family permease
MPTFVQHDADHGSVSVFFLPYTAAAIATRFVGAGLGDRIGHRRVVVPALGALGCAIIAIASVHSVVALALVAVVFGVAQGIVYPTLNAFTIEHVASGQLGRVQTLFNGSFNLGVTAGSFALGGVADAYGHRAAFLGAGLTAHVATVLFTATTDDARAAAMRSSLDSDASASG